MNSISEIMLVKLLKYVSQGLKYVSQGLKMLVNKTDFYENVKYNLFKNKARSQKIAFRLTYSNILKNLTNTPNAP